MKIHKLIALSAIFCTFSLFSTITIPDDAEARRMGRGRSIGRSVPKASPPAGAFTQQRQNPSQNSAINNAGGTAAMSRGFGGFGGIMGGLLAGSLLGSLIGGGGLGGGGGFLDIIIIGLIAFFAFRFFKSRSAQKQDNNQGNSSYQQTSQNQSQNDLWGHLRGEPAKQETQVNDTPVAAPEYFDEAEFMEGAKSLYVRLQASWDERDLDDIAAFATPSLLKEIKEQREEDPNPAKTELMHINGRVMDFKQEEGTEHVTVHFDVLMRENQEMDQPDQVQEMWHFIRNDETENSWKLDGIQQV